MAAERRSPRWLPLRWSLATDFTREKAIEKTSAPEENHKDDREGDQDAGEAPDEDVAHTVIGDRLARLSRTLRDLEGGRIA